jgi:hypothetical protein
MPNTILTAGTVASAAVGLLTRDLVLPMTVTRITDTDFGGKHGDTVTVRVRAIVAANTQAAKGDTIVKSVITEVPVLVSLAHLYSAVDITDEDMSLGIENFSEQILEPQQGGLGESAEDQIAAVINGASSNGVITDSATAKEQMNLARETLTRKKVPIGDRFVACSPEVVTYLLGVDEFVRADARGDDANAIASAIVGSIYGFKVVETAALTVGHAAAYHRTSMAFANFAPVVPSGAADGTSISYKGVSLRWLRQYDAGTLSDQSVLSTFAGAAGVDLSNRMYKMTPAP